MPTHSSILAWRTPWTEKPGRLWSIGLQKVGHNWSDLASAYWLYCSSPCCSVGLLFIHSTYNSLHLSPPVSHSAPPPAPSPLTTTSLFSVVVEDPLSLLFPVNVEIWKSLWRVISSWVTAEWMGWISGFGHILPAWAQSHASRPLELSCPAQGIRWPRLWGILSGTGTSRPSTISWASSVLPTLQTWAWPRSQATTSSVKPFRWVSHLWPWTIEQSLDLRSRRAKAGWEEREVL